MSYTNKNDKTAQLTACASAITNTFPATQSWVFLKNTYTRGDILNAIQGCIQASQKTKASHDSWRAAVAEERAQYAELGPVLEALNKSLESEYGATSQTLAEFGWVPEKPRVASAESKATSASKARATKKAKKAALDAVKEGQPATASAPAAAPAPAVTPATPKGA